MPKRTLYPSTDGMGSMHLPLPWLALPLPLPLHLPLRSPLPLPLPLQPTYMITPSPGRPLGRIFHPRSFSRSLSSILDRRARSIPSAPYLCVALAVPRHRLVERTLLIGRSRGHLVVHPSFRPATVLSRGEVEAVEGGPVAPHTRKIASAGAWATTPRAPPAARILEVPSTWHIAAWLELWPFSGRLCLNIPPPGMHP